MIYSIVSVLLLLFHPLHISVTEIEFDEQENELEMVIRIFIDDLETGIRAERNQPTLDILKPVGSTTNQLVSEYLQGKIEVSLDSKVQKLNFLGSEKEDDALICYIQIIGVNKWKTISVMNSVLLETFDDQSNLVHVAVRDQIKSMRLIRNNFNGSLTF